MKVFPFVSRDLAEMPDSQSWDLLVAACGYEKRARAISERLARVATTKLCVLLESDAGLSYSDNLAFFRKEDFRFEARADLTRLEHTLGNLSNGTPASTATSFRVAVDISSMPRDVLTAVLATLLGDPISRVPLVVDVFYTPAEFPVEPHDDSAAFISGPVAPRFAGWDTGAIRPVAAYVGLGFEAERALGALEYLEPSEVYALAPMGEGADYEKQMRTRNEPLWRSEPARLVGYSVGGPFDYRVDAPYALFIELEAMVRASLRTHRVVLVPLGPKIFAAVCVIVGLLHPHTAVWRVTSGASGAEERASSGKLIGLTVEVSPSQS